MDSPGDMCKITKESLQDSLYNSNSQPPRPVNANTPFHDQESIPSQFSKVQEVCSVIQQNQQYTSLYSSTIDVYSNSNDDSVKHTSLAIDRSEIIKYHMVINCYNLMILICLSVSYKTYELAFNMKRDDLLKLSNIVKKNSQIIVQNFNTFSLPKGKMFDHISSLVSAMKENNTLLDILLPEHNDGDSSTKNDYILFPANFRDHYKSIYESIFDNSLPPTSSINALKESSKHSQQHSEPVSVISHSNGSRISTRRDHINSNGVQNGAERQKIEMQNGHNNARQEQMYCNEINNSAETKVQVPIAIPSNVKQSHTCENENRDSGVDEEHVLDEMQTSDQNVNTSKPVPEPYQPPSNEEYASTEDSDSGVEEEHVLDEMQTSDQNVNTSKPVPEPYQPPSNEEYASTEDRDSGVEEEHVLDEMQTSDQNVNTSKPVPEPYQPPSNEEYASTEDRDSGVEEEHVLDEMQTSDQNVNTSKPVPELQDRSNAFEEMDILPTKRCALIQLHDTMNLNQYEHTRLQCSSDTSKEKALQAIELHLSCVRYNEAIQQSKGKLQECYRVDSGSKLLSEISLVCSYIREVKSTHSQYIAAVVTKAVRTHQQSGGLLRCCRLSPAALCAKLTNLAPDLYLTQVQPSHQFDLSAKDFDSTLIKRVVLTLLQLCERLYQPCQIALTFSNEEHLSAELILDLCLTQIQPSRQFDLSAKDFDSTLIKRVVLTLLQLCERSYQPCQIALTFSNEEHLSAELILDLCLTQIQPSHQFDLSAKDFDSTLIKRVERKERKEIATTGVKNDAIEVVEERKEIATTGVNNDAIGVVEERKEIATTGVNNDAIGVVEERKEIATTGVNNDAIGVVEERKEIATTGVNNDAIEERKEIATTGVNNDAIGVVEERKEIATTGVKNDAIGVVEERKEIATTGVNNDAIGVVEERKEIATTGVNNDAIGVVEERKEIATTGVNNDAIEERKEIATTGVNNDAIGVVEHRKETGTTGMDNIVLENHITVEHNEDVSIDKSEEVDPFDEMDVHPTICSALVQAQFLYHAMDFNEMGYTLLQCTPNTSKEKAILAFGLGLACYKQERYDQAIQQLQESEGKLRECYRVDSDSKLLSDISLVRLYMGEVESTHGQYLAAKDHFAEAVRTHQQSSGLLRCYGLTPLTKCAKLTKLALALRSANRVSESVNCYREALSCGQSTSEDIMSCHISLGNLLHNVGDHETAVEEYHKAIDLAETQKDYQSLCWSHGNLGNAYLSLGMKDKAVYHLELALSLTEQYDPVPSSLSRALNNVGTAYQALNDIDTAEDYYDQALCQSIYGEDLVGQARAYGNIGNLCMVQKDPERAIPHYTEVLRLSKERSTSYVAYHNRGCGFYELGHKRINEQLTTGKRVDFQFTAYGPHTRDLESKHQQQEFDENLQKLFKQGLSDFEKVIENHENTFSHISSSPKGLNLSVCLFENNSKTFSRAQDCAFYLGDHYRALILAERSRSRTLGELLLKRMLSMKTPLHSPLGLDQIVDIMKLQDPHVPVVMLSYTGNRLLIWVLIYDGEDVKMDMIEQEPSEDLFEGKSLDNYLRYSLSELLTGNLELYGEEKESLVKDTPDSLEPNNDIGYSVPELEEQMTTDIDVPITNNKKYQLLSENHFLENEDGITERHYQSLPPKKKMSPINKLYKLIVQPVQELLKAAEPTPSSSSLPKKKLILVPDSSTKLVPFCALKDTDDERCFGDSYSIQFAPSLLTLGILGQTQPIEISIPHDREEICVVGDPTTPPFTVKGREWNLGPLPHAKEEAEWVGHYMKTTPLLHHEPTKNVVLSRLKSAKIIHLATHGSASQAFLVLAGMSYTYNREITLTPRITEQFVQDEKDLLLYASDVESLSLSAGLVVLSSCDSGRGLIKGGDIQGMARAFLLAGSQAVLTSLWKVPDQSACYFMQFFYRYLLDGLSSSEALQKSVLSIRGFVGFSQLIHWSGYQLTGKDIRIRNENANEEREVESMLGHRCSPFPRLNLLTELHNKIVKDSSTDIQVLYGSTDACLIETVIDFVTLYHKEFPGGIIWLNACNEELLETQCKQQKISDKSLPVLIVIDSYNPGLMGSTSQTSVTTFLQQFSSATIIMTTACPDERCIEKQLGLNRFITSHDVCALTNLQVTQRLIYSIQSSHHLTPSREDQNGISKLSSLCHGSPLIVDIMNCVIYKFIEKSDNPSEGIHSCVQYFDDTLALLTNDEIDNPLTIVVCDILKCLISEQFLSSAHLCLLFCLSMFGSIPIPKEVITAIAAEIHMCTPNDLSVHEIYHGLCNMKILQQYPKCNALSSVPDLYYIPEFISDMVYCELTRDIDLVTSMSIIHLSLDKISSLHFPIQCSIYIPSLLKCARKNFRKLCPSSHKELLVCVYSLEIVFRQYVKCCLES